VDCGQRACDGGTMFWRHPGYGPVGGGAVIVGAEEGQRWSSSQKVRGVCVCPLQSLSGGHFER